MPSELSFIPATVFRDGTPQRLNEEQEQLKREIYERMNPRRRKFVDRIGYDNWDPFQKPNDQAHHPAAGARVPPAQGRQERTVRQRLRSRRAGMRSGYCEP